MSEQAITEIGNNITVVEALIILSLVIGGSVAIHKSGKHRRPFFVAASVLFILYVTLLRRIPSIVDRRANPIPLDLYGFFLEGFLLNVFLFLPLGMALDWRHAWLPFALSVAIEITQQVTLLGMLDVWDILANTLGAWLGIAAHWIVRRVKKTDST